MKQDSSAVRELWLKLKSKTYFSLLSFFTLGLVFSGSAYASFTSNLIQDVELRTQYNLDAEDYNNTLRFKLGSLKSGSKNKILDFEAKDEQSNILYLMAEMHIITAANNAKIKLAKSWRKDLSRVYSAYKEYLKSRPSSANSSTDLKAMHYFALAEDETSKTPNVDFKRALEKDFNHSDLEQIKSRESRRLKLTKDADKSENQILTFAEIGMRGKYDNSDDNETVVRLGISLPLGFTGQRTANRKQKLANEFKVKRLKLEKELQFKKALLDMKLKKSLLEKISAKRVTKSRVKKITSSSSLGAEDKLKVYLESLEIKFKKIELKAELALLHNTIIALGANPNPEHYIGTGL